MIIIGAKGFAKEILEVLHQNDAANNLAFFDDVSLDLPTKMFGKFPVLRSEEGVKQYFADNDNFFTIGIGNPILRRSLANKFESWGGELKSTISTFAHIGTFGCKIAEGCNIMTGTVLTSDIEISCGVLINLNCTIGHDSYIGEYVELSPGVHISGHVTIGSFSSVGTNAAILPNVNIGSNVIIAAGAVVTKDVPENSMVAGIPAVIKKQLPPLNL